MYKMAREITQIFEHFRPLISLLQTILLHDEHVKKKKQLSLWQGMINQVSVPNETKIIGVNWNEARDRSRVKSTLLDTRTRAYMYIHVL